MIESDDVCRMHETSLQRVIESDDECRMHETSLQRVMRTRGCSKDSADAVDQYVMQQRFCRCCSYDSVEEDAANK